ncbi:ANR family transcriptional regulator [Vibrio jasicida]|uniref:ANR family transcriptional regulator n=1 Tax=Vibrio jasicida TaxID=766224 RepID=UPI001268674F
MKKKYIELAQRACEAERQRNWALACKLWHASINSAYGKNKPWATARYEFCCYKSGTRPSSFTPRF